MAKCSICNTRKGKRKCLISDGLICSLCCGTTRQTDSCTGCGYYQAPKRKYNDVPRYTPQEMSENEILEEYSRVLESTLYAYEYE